MDRTNLSPSASSAALDRPPLARVHRSGDADSHEQRRDRERGGVDEEHVHGADTGDQEAGEERAKHGAQADDRTVTRVHALDWHVGQAREGRHEGESGRISLGVDAREDEHEHDDVPVFEQSCEVQCGDRGDGRPAHDVREDAAAPEAQPVDERTPEDGHEQPESECGPHEPRLRGAAGRLEDEPWPRDDRHHVADLRDALGCEQGVHRAPVRGSFCRVSAQSVCASTVIHVRYPAGGMGSTRADRHDWLRFGDRAAKFRESASTSRWILGHIVSSSPQPSIKDTPRRRSPAGGRRSEDGPLRSRTWPDTREWP